jgi:hypothetical protein
MLPHKEPSIEELASNVFAPIQDLYLSLHELLCMKQNELQYPCSLICDFNCPKFSGQMNGDTVDSWIYSPLHLLQDMSQDGRGHEALDSHPTIGGNCTRLVGYST